MPVAHPNRAAVVNRLLAAGCVAADEEATLFLAGAPDEATLEGWLRRRERGEPPAWITERVQFCDRPLHIAAGVYVPRPQTEELARRAAAVLPGHGRALDLCTGCGAVAAHLRASVPTAAVIGVDVDRRAVACARRNGVVAVAADVAEPVQADGRFDVVTAVAPYVPTDDLTLLPADVQRYEPRSALDGGADGLDLVRRVIAAAGRLLAPGGWLLVEVGGDQDQRLGPALATGFGRAIVWHDDDGDLRGLAAQRSASRGADHRRQGALE